MQCFKSPGHNGIGFPTVHVSYSTIQCLQPVHGQQDTFSEQKMHPSTQQNSGLKLSMNIVRTLTSNTGFHTTRRSLRPLVGHPYSFRERYREKSIVFTPPPSPRHRGFRFPAVQHTPCLFRHQRVSLYS
ncbi:hypothetical protein TNCT_468011 [Trichonephila clavata]|uniref:Uncharacterized protein n=1 Tax=Trichonephila clavata TaxID=2740835 RepID=A0A8X6LWT8_TRICU|nr:hypothetical protein TNCT_468011 [Trichonephila clavata]